MISFWNTYCRAVVLAMLLACPTSHATTILVNVLDGAGEGLNDPTTVAPVGGNNGTTIGEQRTVVMQYAAAMIETIIDSPTTIVIDAQFNPLSCTSTSGTLGQAGAAGWSANTSGVPLSNTWYPYAMLNAFAGTDLWPGAADITVTFNSSIDNNNNCLQNTNFYYGLDGNAGASVDLLTTTIHEIIHGLGFQTLVDLATGDKGGVFNYNDVFMRNLEDHSINDNWGDPTMNNSERATSAIDDNDLHWTGANVTAHLNELSNGVDQGHLQMHAPNPLVLGSSVSHFDTSTTPNQTMEPVATGPKESIGITRYVLQDLGWSIYSNNQPIISGAGNQIIDGSQTTTIQLAVVDNDSPANSLTLTAESSDTGIIPSTGLAIAGTARNRSLQISPTIGASGNVIVTLTVSDGTESSQTTIPFSVTSNLLPSAAITSPANGDTFFGAPFAFTGSASDPEDLDISNGISWSSSLDGFIGSGASIAPSLQEGTHTIVASVTDSDGNPASDTISVTVDQLGDADSDGLDNQTEIALGTDPENADSDNDFLSDFDEVNMDGDPSNYTPGIDTDPTDNDTDSDGSLDGQDSAPLDPTIGAENIPLFGFWSLLVCAGCLFGIAVFSPRNY